MHPIRKNCNYFSTNNAISKTSLIENVLIRFNQDIPEWRDMKDKEGEESKKEPNIHDQPALVEIKVLLDTTQVVFRNKETNGYPNLVKNIELMFFL